MKFKDPTWWAALASVICGGFGVADSSALGSTITSVVAGGAALVVAVWVHSHHKTTQVQATAAADSVRPIVVTPATPPAAPVMTEAQAIAIQDSKSGTLVSGPPAATHLEMAGPPLATQ